MRLHKLTVLCLVLSPCVPPPAQAQFNIRSADVNGGSHLFLRDIAAYYSMTLQASGKDVHLSSRYSRLAFTVDKRECVLNRVKVNLSLPLALYQREPVLSEQDFRLLLDPILRWRALPQADPTRIMIDPGHGGADPGATGKRLRCREKDITLQIASRLATALAQEKYLVGMTRRSDAKVARPERCSKARQWKADLFISIHANTVAACSVKGLETFILAPKGTPSTYGKRPNQTADSGNRYDKQNARLAYEMQKNVVAATRCVDRGVKHAQFDVLRDAPCPAVLVEAGFLSNATEEQRLGDALYQAKIVTGIVAGIRSYCNTVKQAR